MRTYPAHVPSFPMISSAPQFVLGGLTEPAAPRNATVIENILLAVTRKRGAVSVRLNSKAHSVTEV